MFKDLPVGRRLELTGATPYPDGTVISTYRRPRRPRAATVSLVRLPARA